MPTQRLEPAGAVITIWGSCLALIAECAKWMTDNMALISVLTLVGGFAIQFFSSRRNKAKIDADERRAQEEHALQMEIMRRELAEHRAIVEVDKK